MKVRILLFFFVCFYLGCFAQLKKDDALLGLGLNYTLAKTSTDRLDGNYTHNEKTTFNGNVKFGYFIKDGLAFGGLLLYNTETSLVKSRTVFDGWEEISNQTQHSKQISVGPFLRSYKTLANSKIAFFLQLEAVYQSGKLDGLQKGSLNGNPVWIKSPDGKINGVAAALRAGFVWFMRERVGVEVSFGNLTYNYQILKNYFKGSEIDKHPTGAFTGNFGLNALSLGLSFYLCERKS